MDGELLLHEFKKGTEEPDPALRWFVDLRIAGNKLPRHPERIRQWLIDKSGAVHQGLQSLAMELKAGMEPDLLPLTRTIKNAPRGVIMKLVCSAVLRKDALDMATIIRDLDKNWEKLIRGQTPRRLLDSGDCRTVRL